jgi:hypothetical protein
MAVPALRFEPEDPVEQRITKLENNVEHILSDVSEIKVTMLRLDTKIDGVQTSLGGKIDTVQTTLNGKIDAVQISLGGKIDSLRDVVSSLTVTVANQATTTEKGFGELRGVIANQAAYTEKAIGSLATNTERALGVLSTRIEHQAANTEKAIGALSTTLATAIGKQDANMEKGFRALNSAMWESRVCAFCLAAAAVGIVAHLLKIF